jgi:superfamily II DNA/RNA helicase
MKHRIIDNSTDENSLLNRLRSYINNSESMKIASGYFFIGGFNKLIEELKNLKEIKLLISTTSNRDTIEEIALGYRYRDDIENEIYKNQRKLNKRDKDKLIADAKANLRLVTETAESTDENEAEIKGLADFIKQGRLKVNVYLKGKLHSKAYIMDYKKHLFDEYGNKIERSEDGVAIVGSSNFTLAGLTHNTELNVLIEGNDEHEYLKNWFGRLWDESEDFSEEFFEELSNSWALNYPTPYQVYLKILYHIVKERIEDSEELVLEDSDIFIDLTKFQKTAVAQAISILEKYYGVFISDVVGLGKSFIGSALIDYYHKRGKRALIICPARLEEMWEHYNDYYDLGADILSMGMLSQENGLVTLNKYKDKEIILIDESHNFRNTENNRYRNMLEFLLQYDVKNKRKLILLTATPQNNSPLDVYHQIKLFHHEDETNIPITPPDLGDFIKEVLDRKVSFQSLLQRLLIRRTRKHIKKYYPDEKIKGKLIIFPKRNIPEPITYSIEDVYENMYDEILEYLRGLTFARYNLFNYVKEDYIDKSPYKELQSAGKNLRGFIKVLLLKRIESSVFAFKSTIKNLINIHETYLHGINNLSLLPIGDSVQKLIYSVDDISDDSLDFDSELEKLVSRSKEKYKISCFEIEKLVEDLNEDLRVFKNIYGIIENITPDKDDKLLKLKEKIKEIRSLKGKNEKILIFSQYADTTTYLYNQLKDLYGEEIKEANSKSNNLINIVKRFAPIANEASEDERNKPINILVSTDVLSEGQNLQDCSFIINYDIHWNPVRLIQRVGRVDRIGSEKDEIDIFNFFPEAKLEQNLRISERVSKRIQEIHNIFGEDGKYLDDREILNETDMYAIYDKRDESILDEEEFIVNEAEGIIRKLMKENPLLFEKIKGMHDNLRCIRKSSDDKFVIFCKKANSYSFFVLDGEGNIITQNDDEALKLLKASYEEVGLTEMPKGANKIIKNTFNEFKERLRKVELEREKRLSSRTDEQSYVLDILKYEIDNLNNFSDEYSERKAKLNELYNIYENILPTAVIRRLRKLKKDKVDGGELESALIKIKNNYSLTKEREIVKPEKEIPKIICSEIFKK